MAKTKLADTIQFMDGDTVLSTVIFTERRDKPITINNDNHSIATSKDVTWQPARNASSYRIYIPNPTQQNPNAVESVSVWECDTSEYSGNLCAACNACQNACVECQNAVDGCTFCDGCNASCNSSCHGCHSGCTACNSCNGTCNTCDGMSCWGSCYGGCNSLNNQHCLFCNGCDHCNKCNSDDCVGCNSDCYSANYRTCSTACYSQTVSPSETSCGEGGTIISLLR